MTNRRSRPRLVVLLSQLAGNGGIPRYNRLVCRTLTAYQHERGLDVDVISLNDPPGWFEDGLLQRPLVGCRRQRWRFVVAVFRALLRPYSLVLVGHVDLGPVALFPNLFRRSASMLTVVYGEEVWARLAWHKRLALAKADVVWAISAYTKTETARHQGIPESRVQVMPNALDPVFADRAKTYSGSRVRTRLLTISRLTRAAPGKGVDNLISALPGIRVKVPNVDLGIIGGGDDVPRLEHLAESLGVRPIVTFVGEVADSDLHRYLSGTDVFVLPSRREGFGIVFLEAMAHSRPVIAGAHGGSPEVVENGITGLLVPHGDVPALVDAAATLLENAELRRRMGKAGAERYRALFQYERFRDSVFALLDRTVAAKGTPGIE